MSDFSSSHNRKRSAASSRFGESTKRSNTTPYSGNFEQKLKDVEIYPNNRASKPQNLREIQEAQSQLRASLSPSWFKDEDFEEFMDICESTADDETTALSKIMPFIAGRENGAYQSKAGIPFNNLEPFDKGLSEPRPDMYYGVPASAIHTRVRADLGKYIVPSTISPAAPNSFWNGRALEDVQMWPRDKLCMTEQ
ncbi:hypothetical protein LTR67_004925 [Exophiala xenobiotica]|jgi:hypothetical protein